MGWGGGEEGGKEGEREGSKGERVGRRNCQGLTTDNLKTKANLWRVPNGLR